MRAIRRDRWDQPRRRRTRTDHDDPLAGVIEILGPILRVNDHALEAVQPAPFRRVALRMAVVSLTHPQELRGEADRLRGVGPNGRQRPPIVAARPGGRCDPVTIADVAREIVLVDDLAHIAEDLGRGRDRRAGPRFEAIAEGIEIAVGADARIAVGRPGAAEALLFLEDDKAGPRALF